VEVQQRQLEEGNFTQLHEVGDRLIKTISEDASDASDIWRSVVRHFMSLHHVD
jgi:hypothetical protein